ncbi:MAG: hypothetical protein A2987_04420 [Omnitrophica bacterium RIFCSPLOWO2_01_FULL_45_10]|nr:MAG: hypothetical protein A2987_04420 [Omnitrophica bacterium RIFCSPLOWO2_01_FULL_45_10]
MPQGIKIICCIFLYIFLCQTAVYGGQTRSYISSSRLVIENGHAYKLAQPLYADVEINGDTIVKRTYAVKKNGNFPVAEDIFQVWLGGREKVTATIPKWLKKLKKSIGAGAPADHENVLKAVDARRGIIRSIISLTVGETFMIEMDNQCPYPSLDFANIVEYRYYKRIDSRPTIQSPPDRAYY